MQMNRNRSKSHSGIKRSFCSFSFYFNWLSNSSHGAKSNQQERKLSSESFKRGSKEMSTIRGRVGGSMGIFAILSLYAHFQKINKIIFQLRQKKVYRRKFMTIIRRRRELVVEFLKHFLDVNFSSKALSWNGKLLLCRSEWNHFFTVY